MSIALKQVFNKDKTFRPKRKFEPGTQRFELHKRAQASLNSGVDLKAAVQLPSGEDQNDWVAVHVVDFFNRINLIYGTICEFCTERTCPVMSGGPKYEYRWQDDLKYKKPTALPAPQYMNLLMDWIEVQINNEDIFPTCVGKCSLPKELPADLQEDPLPPLPGLRPRLHPPLRPGHCDGCRGPCQHLLQTLLLLCHGDEPHRPQGAGALERDDEQDVSLTAPSYPPEERGKLFSSWRPRRAGGRLPRLERRAYCQEQAQLETSGDSGEWFPAHLMCSQPSECC
uniref:MOB kinase activator 3B n=1 Tax=Ovis aries TaxID=9940 RepID=A0AC11D2G4_SHEEP